MPCMCGDTYCWSCGPAQGNYKCPACGRWTFDGGCIDPEKCNILVNKILEAENAFLEKFKCPECKSTFTRFAYREEKKGVWFECRKCHFSWPINNHLTK